MVWYGMVIGGLIITSFTGFTSKAHSGDATLTLDDNAGSSSFVVQDVDKTNQFKVNSDGQGYFAGNVGIGTTNPQGKLMVQSSDSQNIKVTYDGGYYGFLGLNNNVGSVDLGVNLGSGNDNWMLRFMTWGTADSGLTPKMVIKGNGNVGIGTTAPTEKLDVAGNIKASGTVSQGSSREYKKNISYVSTKDAMNAFNKLNPVRFEYKADNSGEKHLGFIAEDVPDLVAEGDRKHLNAMDITAVLTKVVQEQQKMLQEQQETISVLKVELEEVKGKIQ